MTTQYTVQLVRSDYGSTNPKEFEHYYTIDPLPGGYKNKDWFIVKGEKPLTHKDQEFTVEGKKYKVIKETANPNNKGEVHHKDYDYIYTIVPVSASGGKRKTRKGRKASKRKGKKGTRRA